MWNFTSFFACQHFYISRKQLCHFKLCLCQSKEYFKWNDYFKCSLKVSVHAIVTVTLSKIVEVRSILVNASTEKELYKSGMNIERIFRMNYLYLRATVHLKTLH